MKQLIDAAALTGYAPLWYTLGGSKKKTDADYAATRGIAWSFPTDVEGARKLVDRIFEDCAKTGCKRVVLHNPFGKTGPDGPMELDQFVAAQEGIDAGTVTQTMQHFLDDCAREFMRLTVAGIEVIWYFGTTEGDPQFDESGLDAAAYYWRFFESVRPALKAGGSIAFDSASDAAVDSLRYKCMQLIRRRVEAYGGKCYIEPRPLDTMDHLHDWNIISVGNLPWRHNAALFADASGAPDTKLTGEMVVFLDANAYGGTMYDDAGKAIAGSVAPAWSNTAAWYEDEMRRCRRMGYTPTAHPAHARIGDPDQAAPGDDAPPAPGTDAQVAEYKALVAAAGHIDLARDKLAEASVATTSAQQKGLAAFLGPITAKIDALHDVVKDRL